MEVQVVWLQLTPDGMSCITEYGWLRHLTEELDLVVEVSLDCQGLDDAAEQCGNTSVVIFTAAGG